MSLQRQPKEKSNMGLKNFFKPTKEKIIISIIIFILMIIFFLPVKVTVMCRNDAFCSSSTDKFVQIYKSYNIEGVDYLYTLIELSISYVISCIIANFTSKNKKK